MAALTDKFVYVGLPGTVTSLGSPGKAIGATSINIGSGSNWPTDNVYFAMRVVDSTGTEVPGTYTEWRGIRAGTVVTLNPVPIVGTDQTYNAGSLTQVFIPISSSQMNSTLDGILAFANQDGSLKTSSVQNALGLTNLTGYTPLASAPATVVYNGNRNYTLTFNSTDLTSILSNGMRLRTTRTVTAPTQSTSLNATSQYYSKSSPAGVTFTDNFTCMAWVKLSSYQTGTIISRFASTGFYLYVDASGHLALSGTGGANRTVVTNQALALNKWYHVAATLSMSSGTATTYIDGIAVTNSVTGTGTSLTQAGNIEVGSNNGGSALFAGKIAQAAIFSSVLSQATIQSYASQGLLGTESTLVSAYSFNNTINDLNTTNANNLTANSGAVATNADSPFTGNANGTFDGVSDYAEVTSVAFSTNTTVTVKATDLNTIPTIGGVSAVVYSSNYEPFNYPNVSDKTLGLVLQTANFTSSSGTAVQVPALSLSVFVPTNRKIKITAYLAQLYNQSASSGTIVTLWDGAVGSGTQVGRALTNSSTNANTGSTITMTAVLSGASGNKTYNVGLNAVTNTAGIEASAAYPSYILVEVI